jgi:hypothetical protein
MGLLSIENITHLLAGEDFGTLIGKKDQEKSRRRRHIIKNMLGHRHPSKPITESEIDQRSRGNSRGVLCG